MHQQNINVSSFRTNEEIWALGFQRWQTEQLEVVKDQIIWPKSFVHAAPSLFRVRSDPCCRRTLDECDIPKWRLPKWWYSSCTSSIFSIKLPTTANPIIPMRHRDCDSSSNEGVINNRGFVDHFRIAKQPTALARREKLHPAWEEVTLTKLIETYWLDASSGTILSGKEGI